MNITKELIEAIVVGDDQSYDLFVNILLDRINENFQVRKVAAASQMMSEEKEVEQVDESPSYNQLSDIQKLVIMGSKGADRSNTLAAIKRFNKQGDINRLSPVQRTYLTRYIQGQAGGLGKVSTGLQRMLLKPQDPQDLK